MSERLNELINRLIEERVVYNASDFAAQVGKQRGYVSQALNGKRVITPKFIQSITNRFPQVNPEWLLSGSGDMIVKDSHIGDNVVTAKASGNSTANASINFHSKDDNSKELLEKIAELERLLEEEKKRNQQYWALIEKLTNN